MTKKIGKYGSEKLCDRSSEADMMSFDGDEQVVRRIREMGGNARILNLMIDSDSRARATATSKKSSSGNNETRISSQMIVKTRWLLYAALFALGASQIADTSLAEIYHKYQPIFDSLNASPSSLIEQFQSTRGGQIVSGRSSEFDSPIKRIMELITHHPPVIVVQDQQQASGERPQSTTHQQQIYEQSIPNYQPMAHNQPALMQQSSAGSTRHQWALVDTSQMLQPATSFLAESPQPAPMRIQSSSMPYEHYYLATPGAQPQQAQLATMGTGDSLVLQQSGQHFGVLPVGGQATQLSFAPTSGVYSTQPLSSLTAVPVTELQQDQSAVTFQHPAVNPGAQFPQQQAEERVQPILLSSFVPPVSHATVQQPRAPAPSAEPLGLIPQIEMVQRVPSGHSSAEDSGGGDDEQPNKMANDIEEPSKASRQQDGAEEDDFPASNSGSVSYEDKFDSDKEDKEQQQPRAESSSNVVNGLINVGLNDDCLQCICRAASGCDHLLRCITRGSEEKYCGPFQLTEEYWNKAGSPGDATNNFLSFEDCANEADCAVETVTNYMKKYHKDCDGDDNITCMDYARLHKLAPDECDNTEKLTNNFDAYWPKFQRCAEGYNRSRTGDDEEI